MNDNKQIHRGQIVSNNFFGLTAVNIHTNLVRNYIQFLPTVVSTV
jgi:hypothetical protein